MVLSRLDFQKCNVYVTKDLDTNRCYKVYDYTKSSNMSLGGVYYISGKVNTADKLYLILENHKTDKNYTQNNDTLQGRY